MCYIIIIQQEINEIVFYDNIIHFVSILWMYNVM